jgi:hypothetical protein
MFGVTADSFCSESGFQRLSIGVAFRLVAIRSSEMSNVRRDPVFPAAAVAGVGDPGYKLHPLKGQGTWRGKSPPPDSDLFY